ncbi:hypothetical protein PHYSODRAFT_304945 [Phytophthora sojae]|uniref:Uncharacterized protein n=1 Tax=Phytophthora sojae (strain P6497) TaxID=1094619 RepID=G5A3L8_PHYSP|nr:hypothetical protein PHYSODRAFT_304945 [Phytophthora sojae]EGZ09391.1 hypothetical protein PHYSODRAFT_304945 [Phytophthora sojae]|eukprot:XP_009534252.1 hypothetical protein PHYSODRAFT_304945 [Phytophthora sojae]
MSLRGGAHTASIGLKQMHPAIRDEVQHTRTKLEEALVSLIRLEEVVRLAKSVHKSRTPLNTLAPDVQASLAAMASVGMQIGPLLDNVKAGMNASSGVEFQEMSTSRANNESVPATETNPTAEIRSTMPPPSASRHLYVTQPSRLHWDQPTTGGITLVHPH